MPEPTPALAAIVGLGGLFPGAADVEAFWAQLTAARVAPLHSLEMRWGVARERYYAKEPGRQDRTYLDVAHCLSEAALADGTQERQLRAGRLAIAQALASVAGPPLPAHQVGLVCGTSWSAESYLAADCARVLQRDPRAAGVGPDEQLARLADGARIGGPRLAVDTACASSLYALDAAVGFLATGSARRVVVLGLNTVLPLWLYLGFARLGALSEHAQLLPFARNASGIVPGECAACVVIERPDEAHAAGRRALALVRGIGLSADGANRSVFAPTSEGQRLACARAYAQLDSAEVDYIEAHGTATVVGDEVELQSLHAFFRDCVPAGRRVPVGSVKALIGHTLAAAGMASLIKCVLVLDRRKLVPHIPVDPHPLLADSCLELPQCMRSLEPPSHRPLRASVCASGFGGANAHVVLEAPGTQPQAAVRGTRARRAPEETCEPIAIVDFELMLGAQNVRTTQALAPQPEAPAPERFWFASREQRALLGPGHYLPERLAIDSRGLRMGPVQLRRIDALQLLITQLARDIAARTPAIADQQKSAVLVVNNLGGEKALALARRLSGLFDTTPRAAPAQPALTLESVASGLSSMCSGYPAFHLDLRGFHQSFAGGPGTFWNGLLLAPHLLRAGRDDIEQLLLGAARLIKSPLDIEAAAAARGERRTPEAEAVGLFALTRLSHARAARARVLGVLQIVPHADARAACAQLGRDPCSLQRIEVCQLAPAREPRPDSSQAASGFLWEAAGVESLARALLVDARLSAIEVFDGDQRVLCALVEREQAPLPARSARAQPLSVYLTPNPWAEAAAPIPTRSHPVPPESERIAHSWLEHTGAVMRSYFAAERSALQLLEGGKPAPALPLAAAAGRLRPPPHGVLRHPHGTAAELLVDSSHPYFFDHALDHVPAILMVEAVQQLAEYALPATHWPSALSLRFVRFCELEPPVSLGLTGTSESAYRVRFEQKGHAVAQGELRILPLTAASMACEPAAAPSDAPLSVSDKGLLHKAHAGNVLVTPLCIEQARPSARALPPPPGHVLGSGDPAGWSLTYLLEVARQTLMQAAHSVLEIPRDRPMSLLSIAITTSAPIGRSQALSLSVSGSSLTRLDGLLIADVTLELHVRQLALGEVRIKTQVVDAQTYQEQRWRRP